MAWTIRSLILVILAAFLAACSRPAQSVILVTVAGARGSDLVVPAGSAISSRQSLAPVPDTVGAAAAVMTGVAGGAPGWAGEGDLARVPPEVATLAELVKREGYETRAYLGDGALSTLTGLARGFDSFSTPSAPAVAAIAADEAGRLRPWRGGFEPARSVAARFLTYLRSRANQNPLFVWIHLSDPIAHFDPTDPASAYEAAITDVNEAIGLLRDALDSYGLSGRTTLIVAPLFGMGQGAQGEQRFGLTLSDPVVLETITLIGEAGGKVTPPPSLAGIRDMVLDILEVDAAKAPRVGPSEPVAVTSLPIRLFGWPALRRAAGEPAPEFRLPPGAGNPAEVLRLMGEAHVALASQRAPDAVAALREAARLAPAAIAPRALLVELVPPSERTAILEEMKSIAFASLAGRIDVSRTLAGIEETASARALIEPLLSESLTPGERVAVAEQLATIGAVDAAVAQLEILLEKERDAPELYEWQGDLFLQTQNAYRARVAYEKALESPRQRSAGLLAKLGNALADLGEKDAALARWAEAVRLDPSYRYPYTRAAEVLLAQGKEGEAAAALVKSVGLTGDPAQDVLNQARALEHAGMLAYAATILDEAIAKDPNNLALQLGMARLLGAGGRYAEARQRLRGILDAQPGVAQAWIELARVEAQAGAESAAIAALDAAEPVAGPQITETVRVDKVLTRGGPDSALARRAAAFQGRGQAKAQPPTQRGISGAPAGAP